MSTVASAFDSLIRSLELPADKHEEAARQAGCVHKAIESRLAVAEPFTSGSFGRGTAIQPLHDIDLFLVLSEKAHAGLKAGAPLVCLEAIQSALSEEYKNKEPAKIQRRSVNIEFSGTGIGFDIVPAFAVRDDVYLIPDRSNSVWIESNPRVHREKLIAANEAAGSMLVSLIKVLKLWNRHAGGVLRSFHLEVMTYGLLKKKPDSFAVGLRDLFEGLSRAILLPCPEPAGLGPILDEGMEQKERERAAKALGQALELAKKAVDAGGRGATEEAHSYWTSALGESYPETGRAPKRVDAPVVTAASASASARTSVDAPSKRFG